MAENKKALIRYLSYDTCLNNTKRKYTYKDLIKYANEALCKHDLRPIGKSQFYKDIEFMRYGHWKAPIETYNIGRNKYYKYTAPFSIQRFLSAEQITQELENFFNHISFYSPFKYLDWYEDLPFSIEEKQLPSWDFVGFDKNELYEGAQFIGIIIKSILNKNILNVHYLNPLGEAQEYYINPYYLKNYNQRWYLLAKLAQSEGIATFSLHKFTQIKQLDCCFEPDTTVNWRQYFKDRIGIDAPPQSSVEEVVLLMSAQELPNFVSKPLHASQQYYLVEGDMAMLSIKVICNRSLENLLLSYAERVQILQPLHLKDKIIDRLMRALMSYRK